MAWLYEMGKFAFEKRGVSPEVFLRGNPVSDDEIGFLEKLVYDVKIPYSRRELLYGRCRETSK